MTIQGLVIRNTGSHYLVLCDDGVERACLAKGKLRLKGLRSTNPIVVGDRVEVELRQSIGSQAQARQASAPPHSEQAGEAERSREVGQDAPQASAPTSQKAEAKKGNPAQRGRDERRAKRGRQANKGSSPEAHNSPQQINEETHYIREILPRRNCIVRRATNLSKQSHILASNIDTSYLVCTLIHPETSTTFIDRFLANAEAYRVPTELVFNKIDLLSPEGLEALEALIAIYEGIGYPCHRISALEDIGLERLSKEMQGRITLLSGHSGVGKSTLINSLVPEAELRTADISQVHNMGMHTTTFSQMIALEGGGYLIDTPGIKGFGLLDMGKEEVSHYFREIFARGEQCRFGNCTHTHEPACAVLEALEQGEIAPSRYQSYLSILEEQADTEPRYRTDH